MRKNRNAYRAGAAVALAAFVPLVPAYAAQEASTEAADAKADAENVAIVVTGSRIRRAGFDTLQPAIVQDREEIEARAVTNAGDLLNEQASFGVPTAAPIGGQGGGGGQGGTNNGQSQVNFLGLGSARTLTLVNGKRFVSSNSVSNLLTPGSQVDLNAIPVALIDRIETIAVGGAPIYGADAVAGTVNIILRTRYNGIAADGQIGISPDYGDAFRFRTSVVAGTDLSSGRGNITAAIDYTESDGLLFADRPRTAGRAYAFQAPGGTSPFALTLQENVNVAITSQSGLPLLISARGAFGYRGSQARLVPGDPTSPFAQFDSSGNLVPFDPGQITGSPIFARGGDGKDMRDFRSLANNVKRLNTNLFLSYDITPEIRFKGEAWFVRTKNMELANEGLYQSAIAGGGRSLTNFGLGPVPVLLTNPFITAATLAILAPQLDANRDGRPDNKIDTNGDGTVDAAGFFVDRNFSDLQDKQPSSATQTIYRIVGGLEGDLTIGGSNFDWDVSLIYGRARSTAFDIGIVRSRFNQAANAVRDPLSGQIVCADRSNGCVPFNVMSGTVDPAAYAFVTARNEPVSVNSQLLATSNISGPLFTLPAGAARLGIGVEYRREKASYTPSEPDRLLLFDFSSGAASGGFSTKEVYGEILIPLISRDMDIPIVDRLDFEGAARFVDNSVAGTDVTWTAGARYWPVPGLQFRGNYTRSIRAPSITELFLPTVPTRVLARDPCDTRYISQGSVPSRRAANCAAAGVTQPFQSLISDTFQPATSSGNPNLENERATSWSAGIVLKPAAVPKLSFSVDWIDIRITNGIESLGGQVLLNSCYDSAAFPNDPVCSSFTRAPNGQISSIRIGYVNVGSIEFAGLTASADYLVELGRAGSLTLRADYFYTDKLTFTIGSQNPTRRAGEIGNSRHRVNAGVAWKHGPFTLFNQVRWIDGAIFDSTDGPFTRDVRGVPSWWIMNSAVSLEVGKTFSLQLNVDNIFNKSAPRGSPLIFGSTNSGITTYYDGIRGRYASITVRLRY